MKKARKKNGPYRLQWSFEAVFNLTYSWTGTLLSFLITNSENTLPLQRWLPPRKYTVKNKIWQVTNRGNISCTETTVNTGDSFFTLCLRIGTASKVPRLTSNSNWIVNVNVSRIRALVNWLTPHKGILTLKQWHFAHHVSVFIRQYRRKRK